MVFNGKMGDYHSMISLFDIKTYKDEMASSIDKKSKQWWKWSQFIQNQGCKKVKYRQDERIVNGWSNLKNKVPLIREVRNRFADIKPIQFEVGSSKVQKLNVVNDFEFGED